MRITKIIAEDIAQKLTAKKRKEVDKFKKDYEELVTKEYEKQTPAEIKKAFENHPKFFTTENKVYLDGLGFSRDNVSVTRPIIIKDRNAYGYSAIVMNKEFAEAAIKLKNQFENANEAFTQLFNEIQNAIFSLHNDKKVRELFPEAAKHLPADANMLPTVDINKIRAKL